MHDSDVVQHEPLPLQNLGQNNCWSVSSIQFLAYAPRFVAEIRQRQPSHPILNLLDLYVNSCKDKNDKYVDIGACLRQITFGDAQKNTQEDAASALMLLLSRIDQAPPIKVCITMEYKVHPDLTQPLKPGVNYSNYSVLDDMNQRTRCDPVWMIDVTAVAPLVNLPATKVIDSIFSWRPEDSTAKNYYKCLSFDKRSIIQCQPLRSRLTFQCANAPSFLVFTVQRMVDYPTPQKIQGPIRMPSKFQLVASESMYELEAVIVHIGPTLYSGHYITYCKSKGNWWCCNDSSVSSMHTAELPEQARDFGYVYYYKQTNKYELSILYPRAICTPFVEPVECEHSFGTNEIIPPPPIITTTLVSQEHAADETEIDPMARGGVFERQKVANAYKQLLISRAQNKRKNAHWRNCTSTIDSRITEQRGQTLVLCDAVQQQQQQATENKGDDDPLGQFLNIAALITGAIAVAGSLVFGATALQSHLDSLAEKAQNENGSVQQGNERLALAPPNPDTR